MKPDPAAARILALVDAGHAPSTLVGTFSKWKVYHVLRHARPGRKRVRRPATSSKPAQMRGLEEAGLSVERIQEICEVSGKYVYRVLRVERLAQAAPPVNR